MVSSDSGRSSEDNLVRFSRIAGGRVRDDSAFFFGECEYFKLSLLRWNYYILSLINKRGTSVPLFYSSTPCWLSLARIFHELLSRDHEGGLATGQPSRVTAGFRGVPERYVAGADTRGRPEGRPNPWSQQVIHEICGLVLNENLVRCRTYAR